MTATVKRGRGRPPEGERIEVRLPANLLKRIDHDAKREGVTRAEQIRRVLHVRYGV